MPKWAAVVTVRSMTAETHRFQAETQKLLDLMVHSLYSHKEIFLRELVSNASDALDKLRFEAVSSPGLMPEGTELAVTLEVDKEARTLTISDNGIGMSRDEVIENLGTIARSGTRELTERMKAARAGGESAGGDAPAELIGQFGVGFYSAFMVADRVVVVTRRAGEDKAIRWESDGAGEYSLDETTREQAGTTVTLQLKPANEEEDLADFTDPQVLRRVVKTYSDFVRYPVRLGGDTLNSMKALWRKQQSEVPEADYTQFYRQVTHGFGDPLETVTMHAEGRLEYHALLFIPDKAPFDLFYPSHRWGPQLYVKSVKIVEHCDELLPRWLRFVTGVVDSADLPLNVSREILQHDGQLRVVRKGVTRKVLDSLRRLQKDDREKYDRFWAEFGGVVKEGVADRDEGGDKLFDLLQFASTASDEGRTTLADYVSRMKEGQDKIYYVTGESRRVAEKSPHLEAFRAKGIEVLFMVDPIDEIMLQSLPEYDGKKLQSAAQGSVELGTPEERKQVEQELEAEGQEYSALTNWLGKELAEDVREVRVSARLTESAACLVSGEGDASPQLIKLMASHSIDMPAPKRILELNPKHPLCQRMRALHRADAHDQRLADLARLLVGQAMVAEGTLPPEPAEFARIVSRLVATEADAPASA